MDDELEFAFDLDEIFGSATEAETEEGGDEDEVTELTESDFDFSEFDL